MSPRNPIPLSITAIGVLVGAAVLAQVWPDFKAAASLAIIWALIGLCGLIGLAALVAHLFGNESSEPPRQPQATAHGHHTRGTR